MENLNWIVHHFYPGGILFFCLLDKYYKWPYKIKRQYIHPLNFLFPVSGIMATILVLQVAFQIMWEWHTAMRLLLNQTYLLFYSIPPLIKTCPSCALQENGNVQTAVWREHTYCISKLKEQIHLTFLPHCVIDLAQPEIIEHEKWKISNTYSYDGHIWVTNNPHT